MDKRYQVFVSSTYADLREERQKVLQALMEMDCIPAGMELFPATDDEQWQFIKRIIDDCDYYILIIGGRYGSISKVGISYTEMEFDYAISRSIKVLAFVHGSPEQLSVAKSDIDPAVREKLAAFRRKVCANRIVKSWQNASELPGLVALSLQKTLKLYPSVGWVRADSLSNPELLSDINVLRKENEHLRKKVIEFESVSVASEIPLADLGEEFTIRVRWRPYGGTFRKEEVRRSWSEHFSALAPWLDREPDEGTVRSELGKILYRKVNGSDPDAAELHPDDDDFQTFKIQLIALAFIKIRSNVLSNGYKQMIWSLTKSGEQMMLRTRTVKKGSIQEVAPQG